MTVTNPDQPNIFLMPCGSAQAQRHLHDTVLNPVNLSSKIFPHLGEANQASLKTDYYAPDIAVWGSSASRDIASFIEMEPRDIIVFTDGQQIKAMGELVHKTISPKLSKVLWQEERVFSLIYFLNAVARFSGRYASPLSPTLDALGYCPNYKIQGLTCIPNDRLKPFYKNHKSIWTFVQDEIIHRAF